MGWRDYILAFIRYAFIVLFLYAAIYKLIEYHKFYNDLLNSPVFGKENLARFISWVVPLLELIIAGLLIGNVYRGVGLYFAFVLIILFTIYIAGILLFSNQIPCSCGGIINNLTWSKHLIFNSCFILLGALGVYLQSNRRRT